MADVGLHVVNPKVVVRDEEMLRLFCQGLTMRDVARATGWSYATIMKACKREAFMFKLKEYSLEVWKRVDEELQSNKYDLVARLEEAAEVALDEMVRLASEGHNEGVRMKAAQDIMDRDPRISRTKKVEGLAGGLPQINIQILQAAARAMQEEEQYLATKRQSDQKLIELPCESKTQ